MLLSSDNNNTRNSNNNKAQGLAETDTNLSLGKRNGFRCQAAVCLYKIPALYSTSMVKRGVNLISV